MTYSISHNKQYNKNSEENVKKIVTTISLSLPKTINHFFPDFHQHLKKVEDVRKHTEYELPELLFGGISLFLFKQGSRNSYNNNRKDKDFQTNYTKLFGMGLPHMDTVNDLLEKLPPAELEKVKTKMIGELIEKKVFYQRRLLGKYYVVAIDGTGINSYSEKHCDKCLTRTSKSGKQTWFHNVLEAKLVLPKGLSLSLASEWIENEKEDYDKQDCELKAFKRLSKKLKKSFPRLPACR